MPRKPVLSQPERAVRVGTGGQLQGYSKPLWQRGNDLSFITFFFKGKLKKIQKTQKHADVTERGVPGHKQQWVSRISRPTAAAQFSKAAQTIIRCQAM